MKNPTIFADGGECFSLKSIIMKKSITGQSYEIFHKKPQKVVEISFFCLPLRK